MNALENLAAVAFYLGLGGTIGGALLLARAAVEGRTGGRLAVVLLVAGLAGIAVSVALYATGPRRMLPF